MRDPCAVVPSFHFAKFVTAHFLESLIVCRLIISDWNLRRHSTHGMNTAPVANLNQQIDIGAEKMGFHCDFGAIGQDEFGMRPKLLEVAENVVPSTAVESCGMVAQFIENLVHLKGSQDGFDQDSRPNRAARNFQFVLSKIKNIIPKARFEMILQLRQVEIWASSLAQQGGGVVEEEQTEIKQRTRNRLAIHFEVLFIQMPAPRTHHQRRQLRA